MNAKQKKSLKKFVTELEKYRGRHTELVSVYVPADYELIKVIQHLQEEQGTAENIKDKTTRNNVIDSLERMIRHLKLFKRNPPNGLAAFSGNISEKEGQQDIKVWSIEPPIPLKTRIYRCDQTFVLDLLREMIDVNHTYGLIVLDNREAHVGLLRGTLITKVASLTSSVPGKIKAGGQSQARFARLREEAAHEFYKRIAEISNVEFLGMKDVIKGIIIGGPGPTKETFLNGAYLNNELKKKVLGVKDITYTDEFGLQELVDKSQDLLAQEEIIKEKILMQKFYDMLNKEESKTAYGLERVEKALEYGAVEILLISETIDDALEDKLEQKAEAINARVEIISIETREGAQLKDLGGVAAILRYSINQ
jgi:peptide chain release factor subunit 1